MLDARVRCPQKKNIYFACVGVPVCVRVRGCVCVLVYVCVCARAYVGALCVRVRVRVVCACVHVRECTCVREIVFTPLHYVSAYSLQPTCVPECTCVLHATYRRSVCDRHNRECALN